MPQETLFLAHFTFISGEAELPFHHTLLARSAKRAMVAIRRYLRGFASGAQPLNNFTYEYYGGYYAVSFDGLERTASEAVISHLLLYDPPPKSLRQAERGR